MITNDADTDLDARGCNRKRDRDLPKPAKPEVDSTRYLEDQGINFMYPAWLPKLSDDWTWEHADGRWQARRDDDVLVAFDADGYLDALDREGEPVDVGDVLGFVADANCSDLPEKYDWEDDDDYDDSLVDDEGDE